MDRKSAAVVMSWRTTGEIIKDSAVPRELGPLRPGGYDHRLPGRKRFAIQVDKEEREGRAGDSHPTVPSQFQDHRLPGRKRFAIQVDKEEREGRAGDSHPTVPSQFQECGEDDQEADAPRDEREPLASP